MTLSWIHWLTILITVVGIIAFSVRSAGCVSGSDGFTVGGRRSGAGMVAGAIVGTSIGGGATIGTAQLASSIGIAAWWFTLGLGLGLLIDGLFYAARLRNSSVVTVAQFLVRHFGATCGPLVAIVSAVGMFFAVISSVLPGVMMIAAVSGFSPEAASVVMLFVIALYVGAGGMRGASVAGMLKAGLLLVTLLVSGIIATQGLMALPGTHPIFTEPHWRDLWGAGGWVTAGNLMSTVVGVICAQSYIQSMASAKDTRSAMIGCFVGAAITIPVGLPCVAVALYMHALHPEVPAMMVLPAFLLSEVPDILGGLTLSALILAIISSPAGQVLSISTLITRDIAGPLFHVTNPAHQLILNRVFIVLVALALAVFVLTHLQTEILYWNYFSMALRGGAIVVPLTLAVILPGRFDAAVMTVSFVLAVLAACVAEPIFHIASAPIYLALTVSLSGAVIAFCVTAYQQRKRRQE